MYFRVIFRNILLVQEKNLFTTSYVLQSIKAEVALMGCNLGGKSVSLVWIQRRSILKDSHHFQWALDKTFFFKCRRKILSSAARQAIIKKAVMCS